MCCAPSFSDFGESVVWKTSSLASGLFCRVRGFWGGSKETVGRIGCGVVTKGVDKDRWITISEIAVPFEKLVQPWWQKWWVPVIQLESWTWCWEKPISVSTINHCIDDIIKFIGECQDGLRERKMKEVKQVSSLVDVICPEGRRRARSKLGGLCFRSSCFQNVAKTHVLLIAPSPRDCRPRVEKAFDQHRRMVREENVL